MAHSTRLIYGVRNVLAEDLENGTATKIEKIANGYLRLKMKRHCWYSNWYGDGNEKVDKKNY